MRPAPPFQTFESPQAFFSTLADECVHSTGNSAHLNRAFGARGAAEYAREELVAELGSAFLCAHLGIASIPRADHASYVGSWLQLFEDELQPVFHAATHAQRAVESLHP